MTKRGGSTMGSDHNLMLWKFDFNKTCQGCSKGEQDKRRKVKKATKDWRWNRKKKADWVGYRAKVE